jgi:hypothetical protein
MKIGYLRMGLAVEVDVMTGSTFALGTEIRMGLLHDWLKLGYEVAIYTQVRNFKQTKDIPKSKSKSLFDFGDESEIKPKIDLWTDKLQIEPETLDIDANVLWVECGQPNTTFGDHVRRCFDVISHFKGTVIYHQHSDFSFPFTDIWATTDSTSEKNMRVMLKKYDILKDKKWKILSPATNQEVFKTIKNGRADYKDLETKGIVEFGYIPPAYSDVEPFFLMKQNPSYDALWIGGQNTSNRNGASKKDSRYELVKKYYGSGLYNTAVIGDWETSIPNIKMLGVQGKHGDAYKYWNDSLVCINCASEKNGNMGIIPSRFTMALRGGAIMLTDKNFSGIERYIERKFIVSNAEECKNIITEIKNMSLEEREKLRQIQLSKFPKWEELNWKDIFS